MSDVWCELEKAAPLGQKNDKMIPQVQKRPLLCTDPLEREHMIWGFQSLLCTPQMNILFLPQEAHNRIREDRPKEHLVTDSFKGLYVMRARGHHGILPGEGWRLGESWKIGKDRPEGKIWSDISPLHQKGNTATHNFRNAKLIEICDSKSPGFYLLQIVLQKVREISRKLKSMKLTSANQGCVLNSPWEQWRCAIQQH